VSHKHLNQLNPDRPKRVAIVISNPAVSTTTGSPVGFWWAELTHPYFHFTEAGYQVEVFSPQGGPCVADPISDPEDASQWQAEDVISRGYKHDPAFVKLVDNTRKVDDLDVNRFDALVVAGGQGPMFTFESAENLHRKFVEFYQSGRLTAALCHGVAILRYARLATGEPLVQGKTVTGFANVEEDFSDQAARDMGLLRPGPDQHVMPWRIEDELKALGANYVQAGLWKGFAIRDGNLVTGQQNFSGGETAQLIVETLGR
jgi:putative intracellular protease/amidase